MKKRYKIIREVMGNLRIMQDGKNLVIPENEIKSFIIECMEAT